MKVNYFKRISMAIMPFVKALTNKKLYNKNDNKINNVSLSLSKKLKSKLISIALIALSVTNSSAFAKEVFTSQNSKFENNQKLKKNSSNNQKLINLAVLFASSSLAMFLGKQSAKSQMLNMIKQNSNVNESFIQVKNEVIEIQKECIENLKSDLEKQIEDKNKQKDKINNLVLNFKSNLIELTDALQLNSKVKDIIRPLQNISVQQNIEEYIQQIHENFINLISAVALENKELENLKQLNKDLFGKIKRVKNLNLRSRNQNKKLSDEKKQLSTEIEDSYNQIKRMEKIAKNKFEELEKSKIENQNLCTQVNDLNTKFNEVISENNCLREQIQVSGKENEHLKNQIKELEESLKYLNSEKQNLCIQINDSYVKNNEIDDKNKQLQNQIQISDNKNKQLDIQIKNLTVQLKKISNQKEILESKNIYFNTQKENFLNILESLKKQDNEEQIKIINRLINENEFLKQKEYNRAIGLKNFELSMKNFKSLRK
ncbi:MAG: hypothetical protein LBJ32_00075 [Oscillospiraceae bacterium]|jgi:outer membrane murein-binding lipoprotein Lpp|nr:hypothetical protein [Oscillospiraceae bacterium]